MVVQNFKNFTTFVEPEVLLPCPKKPPLDLVRGQMNSVHFLTSYSLKTHFGNSFITHAQLRFQFAE
jgi:hypothetical protein